MKNLIMKNKTQRNNEKYIKIPFIKPDCPFQKRKSKTRINEIAMSAIPIINPCFQFLLTVLKKSVTRNMGSALLYPRIIYAAPTFERPNVNIDRSEIPKHTYDAVEKYDTVLNEERNG